MALLAFNRMCPLGHLEIGSLLWRLSLLQGRRPRRLARIVVNAVRPIPGRITVRSLPG